MEPKSMPKLIKNQYQTSNETDQENHQTPFFSLKGKIIQIHCKNNGFEGLTGWAREWKRYQKNNENGTTIHSKIDDKSIHISGLKIDTQNMEINPKSNQKRTWLNRNNSNKNMPTKDNKTEAIPIQAWGNPLGAREH